MIRESSSKPKRKKGELAPLSKQAPPNTALKLILQNKHNIITSKENAEEIEMTGPLVKRAVNIFVAQSGSGKSLCAFVVSWKELKEHNFSRVIYFDLDNQPSIFKDRYANFEKLDEYYYITEKDLLDFFNDVEELQPLSPRARALWFLRHLGDDDSIDNTLTVLDSLQFFVNYNKKEEITTFFDIVRRLIERGATILILHHKSVKADSPDFKGLTDIRDMADLMVEVIPTRDRTNTVKSIKLHCTKNRTLASFNDFILSFDTSKGYVSYDQNVLLPDEEPVKEEILKILREKGEMKQQDIVEAVRPKVSVGINRIQIVLTKMAGLHMLKVEKGKKHTKLYSLNIETLEPGYWDDLDLEEETEEENEKVELPF